MSNQGDACAESRAFEDAIKNVHHDDGGAETLDRNTPFDISNSSTPSASVTHQQATDHTHSLSSSGGLFFADATLDLEEAHDIADTPEATRPQMSYQTIQANRLILSVPRLMHPNDSAPSTNSSNVRASTNYTSNRLHALQENETIENFDQFTTTQTEDTTNYTQNNKETFERISGGIASNGESISYSSASLPRLSSSSFTPPPLPTRPPRWPRDLPWTVAFMLLVPTFLLYAAWRIPRTSALARHPLSFATLHAITWTTFAVAFLARLLYRSPPGGDGDMVRANAAQMLATLAPISVLVYATLTLTVWLACPTIPWAALLPAWYTLSNVYAFRRWNRRTYLIGSGYPSRLAFFEAVTNMALDVLSRSLRRISLYRALTVLLLIQLLLLLLWRYALFGALSSSVAWVVVTLVVGKWATGTLSKLLTLLACSGVLHWCHQQGLLLANVAALEDSDYSSKTNVSNESILEINKGDSQDNKEEIYTESYNSEMPEAYQTIDASVYQSVLVMDEELLDDDYDDLKHETIMDIATKTRNTLNLSANGTTTGVLYSQQRSSLVTVKSILWIAMSINFGSMAHGGLLGGLAQFVYSQIRRVEYAQIGWRMRNGEFTRMDIGSGSGSFGSHGRTWSQHLMVAARVFVRNNSDLAMTYVAVYQKGYARAARDVADLIKESGLEPILHEDITTHMCTCVAGSLTGLIVLITTYLLLHQRHSHAEVNDWHIVKSMMLSFLLSYTLIFTALEPLRAAIKASYVAFAQNPRCLSQSFPLIYHRLCRLSESNNSNPNNNGNDNDNMPIAVA